MWLTALVNALPAIAGIAKDVINHDDKAGQAAQVAADPNAPAAVKQAAANVAANAIDAKAAAEKAAIAAASGKKPQQSSDNTAVWLALGVGALLFMGKRRR
jgi:hypothetical protein